MKNITRLTLREAEIAQRLAMTGENDKQLGEYFGISWQTAHTHVTKVLQKVPGLKRPTFWKLFFISDYNKHLPEEYLQGELF